ncbi:MAG: hypothetical protein P4L61_04365, partial [Candidatus Pacebacteria bacterium]|nr:hypothetical protein [Candidatus Paceibacterota bacterium]
SARAKGTTGAALEFDSTNYHAFGADAAAIWDFTEGNGTTRATVRRTTTHFLLSAGTNWLTGSNGFNGGNALNFTGITGSATNFKNFNPNTGSVSFWVNMTNTTGNFETVICISGTTATCNPAGLDFWTVSDGTVCSGGSTFMCVYDGSFVTTSIPVSSVLGKWTQVTVSWSGTTLQIYVNGQLAVSSNTYNSSVSACTPTTACYADVGWQSGFSRNLNGSLAHLRVYTSSLF